MKQANKNILKLRTEGSVGGLESLRRLGISGKIEGVGERTEDHWEDLKGQ